MLQLSVSVIRCVFEFLIALGAVTTHLGFVAVERVV